MPIVIDPENKLFTLHTNHSTYQMKVESHGMLLHTYYGPLTDDSDKSYAICFRGRGFSGTPYDIAHQWLGLSWDTLPLEYSTFGTGDFRISAFKVQNQDGSYASSLVYKSHSVQKGKYGIEGLPAVYVNSEEAQTLEIVQEDPYTHLEVHLLYGVLPECDVITRAVKIVNASNSPVILQKAASMNLDWTGGDYEWITFYGGHVNERNLQRDELGHGIHSIGSVRGTSSHQYNPFAVVCEKGASENTGICYGISLMYSGEFQMEAEKDQADATRLICGIHPDNFAWTLNPGQSFDTPEVILTYSSTGMGTLSRNLHKTIRNHICRGIWKDKQRPVLINNWEATYFNFTGDKLVDIARNAHQLGVDLFVLDDGWFGKRDDDFSGLGDWFPNEKKLGCSLKELAEKITEEGMLFGLWFEPEGFSEDSDLFRAHPEWAVTIPGRKPDLSRNQLVLDFSLKEVQDYIIACMSEIFENTPISYVKWDFNRSICDKYSRGLDAKRQGEFAHRYVLGLYRVMDTLNTRFPHILFEGCSGGGGRFDTGMLYYMPQIWCSDNSDPIARLNIQYGTSFGYPVSSMGAHVSASPNHQTRRNTPFSTRSTVAMAGTFGYELDITKLSEKEKEKVQKQIARFKDYYYLTQKGDYYRLLPPTHSQCTAWEMADPNGQEALVSAVYHHVEGNSAPVLVKVQGLNPNHQYKLTLHADDLDEISEEACDRFVSSLPYGYRDGESLSGAALQHCGLLIPEALQEYQSWQIHIAKI